MGWLVAASKPAHSGCQYHLGLALVGQLEHQHPDELQRLTYSSGMPCIACPAGYADEYVK